MQLGLLTFYFRSPKGSQKIFLGSSPVDHYNDNGNAYSILSKANA